MNDTLTCPSCAAVIGIPETGIPQDGIECVWCGTKCRQKAIARSTPPISKSPVFVSEAERKSDSDPLFVTEAERKSDSDPLFVTEAERKSDSDSPKVDVAANPKKEPPPTRKWIREEYEASDNPDDMLPYLVEAKEIVTEKCQSCQLDRPYSAIICPHCGFDLRTKQRIQREYEPISKTWVLGWPYRVRFTIFIICLIVNVMTFGVGFVLNKEPPTSWLGAAVVIALQAFLLGTFSKLTVKRNRKGASQITLMWRYCFLPAPERVIELRPFTGVVAGSYSGVGISEILVFLILVGGVAAPMFGILFDGATVLLVIELIVPLVAAGLWWYFAMWSVRYYSALTTENQYPDTYLYRGLGLEKSQDITRTVATATGLPTVGGV